jgi:osmotically-inducible protein OsmY
MKLQIELTKELTAMKLFKYLSATVLAVMLATVMGCASTSKHEGTGQYVDDSVITTKVKAAVFHEPSLKSAEINVETYKGQVQLSGFVATAENIEKAVEVARSVEGVTSVKNDMQIKHK